MRAPNRLTALEAAARIERGDLTAEMLTRACLDRIQERDGAVHAFVAIDADLALSQARAADRRPGGLLRGIPVAVKDIIDTVGYDTAYGSAAIYAGHRPPADAGCVASAHEAGAVILGKVATSEFATQTPSATRNPLDLERTPGGSSSGSAAAVADFMVPVAFGTQTTGSITRPAAYCGVVGYKPTFGLISSGGVKTLSHTQDTVGLLTRTVADAAFFSLGLPQTRVAEQLGLRPRIGVCLSSQWQHASPETHAALDAIAARAERAGASVLRCRLPQELEALIDLQSSMFAYEARQSLAHERTQHREQLSARLQTRLAGGETVSAEAYLQIRSRMHVGTRQADAMFGDFDALLYPAADGEAELGLTNSGSPRFGALWTALHLPTIALRIATGPAGLPIGAQLIGRYADDARLLAVASVLARIAGYDQ